MSSLERSINDVKETTERKSFKTYRAIIIKKAREGFRWTFGI